MFVFIRTYARHLSSSKTGHEFHELHEFSFALFARPDRAWARVKICVIRVKILYKMIKLLTIFMFCVSPVYVIFNPISKVVA